MFEFSKLWIFLEGPDLFSNYIYHLKAFETRHFHSLSQRKQSVIGSVCLSSSSLERQESVATTEARLRMEGVELKEEWQDEDFPRYLWSSPPIVTGYMVPGS